MENRHHGVLVGLAHVRETRCPFCEKAHRRGGASARHQKACRQRWEEKGKPVMSPDA